MPPTPNRGDSKVGCGRSKQWLGDGRQVSGILQPFCVDAQPSGSIPKPCETAARKMPKRCFWNLLKTKKKSCLKARQTFAQRKTWKPASHQTKPMKNVLGTRMRKSRTPARLKTKKKSCLEQGKPLRNVRLGSLQATRPNSRKRCLGRACEKAEPQQVLCPSHCETAAGKMPKRRLWNPLKTKK